jgi:PHP family Zn ribbon phosphoesterase
MKLIADFHIHSRYSRACSKDLTLPNLSEWAKKKGISLLGTGDFTHPDYDHHVHFSA